MGLFSFFGSVFSGQKPSNEDISDFIGALANTSALISIGSAGYEVMSNPDKYPVGLSEPPAYVSEAQVAPSLQDALSDFNMAVYSEGYTPGENELDSIQKAAQEESERPWYPQTELVLPPDADEGGTRKDNVRYVRKNYITQNND